MTAPAHTRRAMVTGGGTGLGLACVEALVAEGFEVIALGIDRDEGLDQPGVTFHELDVTDSDALAEILSGIDGLDVLVNAAGVIGAPGAEFTDEGFARVIDVNLIGTQKTCFACEDALVARGGSVVNFASVWASFGSVRNPAYAASKGAVVAFTRSLAAGWGARGVRANAVAPGWIETRLSQGALNDPERAGAIQSRIPLGRWGAPADIGAMVAFLASPAASYVTGAVIPVDGGYAIA